MNTVTDTIAISGILVTAIGIVGGWIGRTLGRLRDDVGALRTDVAVISARIAPAGGTPLDVRVSALEKDVGVLKSKEIRP